MWARLKSKLMGGMMTMMQWLTTTFWRAFARWVERDPDAAAERIGAIMENMVEQVVAAQEAALAAAEEEAQG